MRLVAILGMLGSELLIFFAVKKQTQSNWWSIVAVGLFAAAYRVMDTYLDNAHSDSRLLLCVWYFMLPFAMLSGVMGALDPGSNNNVFIPMGTWFILTGVLGMFAFVNEYPFVNKWAIHLAALGLSLH